jgi:hypothetical protein
MEKQDVYSALAAQKALEAEEAARDQEAQEKIDGYQTVSTLARDFILTNESANYAYTYFRKNMRKTGRFETVTRGSEPVPLGRDPLTGVDVVATVTIEELWCGRYTNDGYAGNGVYYGHWDDYTRQGEAKSVAVVFTDKATSKEFARETCGIDPEAFKDNHSHVTRRAAAVQGNIEKVFGALALLSENSDDQ